MLLQEATTLAELVKTAAVRDKLTATGLAATQLDALGPAVGALTDRAGPVAEPPRLVEGE